MYHQQPQPSIVYTNSHGPSSGVTYVHQQAVPPPPQYYAPPPTTYQTSNPHVVFQQPQYTVHPPPPTIMHGAPQSMVYIQPNTVMTGQSPITTRMGTAEDDVDDACCIGASAGLGALLCCLALQSTDSSRK